MNDYNTVRPTLILKEYGRNIQNLVQYLKSIEDKDERSMYAGALIELMKQINPSAKDNTENQQKVWDDLFIMADFDLDIDSPYPAPERDILDKKPDRMTYSSGPIRFKHYGRNLQLMVEKAAEIEDEEERLGAVVYIGRMMKAYHQLWNKENIDDGSILNNIKELSRGKLRVDADLIREENLFEINIPRQQGGGNGSKSNGRRRNNQQNRRRRN